MKFKKKLLIPILVIILLLFSFFLIKPMIKPKLEIKLIYPVNEVLGSNKINFKFMINAQDNLPIRCNLLIGSKFKEAILFVTEKWELFDSENRHTAENSAIFEYNNKIYQVGFGGTDNNKKIIVYDIKTNNWTAAAPYPYGLEGASFTNYNNEFYVFGGSNTTTIHKFAYKYNPEEDRWIKIKDLPYPLRGSTSALIGNKLHMVGGTTGDFDNLEITDKHLVYDFEKKDYYFEKEFPHSIKFSSYGVINNTFYVLGGNTISNNSNIYQAPTDEIYSYNTETKKWKFKARLPQKITVSNRNSVVYNNKILIIGGDTEHRRLSTVYTYDVIANKVEETYPQIPYAAENTNVILIGDKIYLLGGFCLYAHCFEEKYYLDISEIDWGVKPFWVEPIPLLVEPNRLIEYSTNFFFGQSKLSERELTFLWHLSCNKNGKTYNSEISQFEISN